FCNCSGCPKVAINLKDCLRPLLLLRCGLFRPSAPPHCFRHRWAERMLIKEIDAGAMEHQHVQALKRLIAVTEPCPESDSPRTTPAGIGTAVSQSPLQRLSRCGRERRRRARCDFSAWIHRI